MATKKRRAAGPWKNGVRKLGPGKYEVRLTHTVNSKRRDTERVIAADSMGDAGAKREALLVSLKDPSVTGRTVSETIADYLKENMPRGSLKVRISWCKRIEAAFGPKRLGDLRMIDIQKFLRELPLSDKSAIGVRAAFCALYKYAIVRGDYGGENFAAKTVRRHTPLSTEAQMEADDNPVKRAYLGDEAQRFLAALNEDVRPLQALQLFLGCRFGEVSALRWSDVDLDGAVVHIRRGQYEGEVGRTKGKKQRASTIGPHAVAMLRAHRERMAELRWPGWETLVFPNPPTPGLDRPHDMWAYQTVRRHVVLAQKAIGSQVVSRTHAMRHTHITAAEVKRQLDMDASMAAAELKRQMLAQGHATEAQRAQYIDTRALPPSRVAADVEAMLVGLPEET
jgi:integrase